MNRSRHDNNEPTERRPIDPLVIIGLTLYGGYPCGSRKPGFANSWRGIHGGTSL